MGVGPSDKENERQERKDGGDRAGRDDVQGRPLEAVLSMGDRRPVRLVIPERGGNQDVATDPDAGPDDRLRTHRKDRKGSVKGAGRRGSGPTPPKVLVLLVVSKGMGADAANDEASRDDGRDKDRGVPVMREVADPTEQDEVAGEGRDGRGDLARPSEERQVSEAR